MKSSPLKSLKSSFKSRSGMTILWATGLLLVVTVSASAQAQGRPGPCERWTDSQYRCLAVDDHLPNSKVFITNKTGAAIRFRYDEWRSFCGSPGSRAVAQVFSVPANTTVFIQQTPIAGGIGSICKEGFIYECRDSAGNDVRCPDVLNAQLSG